MRKIKFTHEKAYCDRIHYINEADVLVVLLRLPGDIWNMLRVVHFKDQNQPYRGGRATGYTCHGESGQITLLALPPRVSLTSYLKRREPPRMYGATRNYQWPRMAVRRFLLYSTFLHELGHLQVITRTTKGPWEKAEETKADEFDMYWRCRLWLEKFEHADPVHNPPTEEEIQNSMKEIEAYKKVR